MLTTKIPYKVTYTKEGRGGVVAEEVSSFSIIFCIVIIWHNHPFQHHHQSQSKCCQCWSDQHIVNLIEKVSTFLNNWMNGVVAGFLQVTVVFEFMSIVAMPKKTFGV